MIETIYIEEEVRNLPRCEAILERHSKANHIVIERYSEVFNSHAQNFRLQKANPALMLAKKHNRRVLPTPQQYETGGGANYYFSHMLNCLYDCRYCFLQGMYRSANYLLFLNFEDFVTDIKSAADAHAQDAKPPWFFSGYDCDSLAMEPVTGFADHFLHAFSQIPQAVLELRTKSTQVRSLLNQTAIPNVVTAFSLSPNEIASSIEQGAPSLTKRLTAMQKLQANGWRIGVRFDPVIWHQDWQQNYAHAIDQVFATLDPNKVDSVTLGGFRLPKGYFKTMRKLYPDHWLFSSGLQQQGSLMAYHAEIESEMFTHLKKLITHFIDEPKLFVYPTDPPQEAGA